MALTFREAAQYLGKHENALEYYHKQGWLTEDYRFGKNNDRMYEQATLDEFRQKYLASPYLTLQDIAKRYGKTKATVHHHFRMKRKIEPAGQRGNTLTFYEADVIKVAKEEGWKSIL